MKDELGQVVMAVLVEVRIFKSEGDKSVPLETALTPCVPRVGEFVNYCGYPLEVTYVEWFVLKHKMHADVHVE